LQIDDEQPGGLAPDRHQHQFAPLQCSGSVTQHSTDHHSSDDDDDDDDLQQRSATRRLSVSEYALRGPAVPVRLVRASDVVVVGKSSEQQ